MTHYSIEPIEPTFVKSYRFMSFVKNVSKKIGNNKYSQKLLEHLKESATDALKSNSK